MQGHDDYFRFLALKQVEALAAGLDDVPALHPAMKGHQRVGVDFALRLGRSAFFYDTGLGKSLMELEWGRVVAEHTNRPVLLFAPLAVAAQHAREAGRWGIPARVVRHRDELRAGVVNLTNYEMQHHFRPDDLGGVGLDESSIIKSFTGVTTRRLMAFAESLRFRLAATATPAPNDHMELGQHAQFLGVMDSSEMLSRWFIADQRDMGRYRLKRHGVTPFWNWVASWARACAKPSDLGFCDDGYELPPLAIERVAVRAPAGGADGALFRLPGSSATEIHKEKRLTAPLRAAALAEEINDEHRLPWVVWCDTDYEADELTRRIPAAVEVRGSMPTALKEKRLLGFADGSLRVLVTKPRIAGFGLNWQHCHRVDFVGLSFSYEQFYQAIRRCWRFGQDHPVKVRAAVADTEMALWRSISRKQGDHAGMQTEMRAAMRRAHEARQVKIDYRPELPAALPPWLAA